VEEEEEHIKPIPIEQETSAIKGMYREWFLDYASYVILERAVPALQDGLKPVQRRILHSMKEMDDGRYNKVANVIGHTMQYHPHGDAAIGDAMVKLGQKDLLIDTQGNWGDVRTGDSAAASRYIEARLTKFALEVAFNKQTTEWQKSYDGRKQEPVTLPMKFPLLLTQGVEGIAVGLSTRILPHNFIELIKGSIDVLKGKTTNIMPDFPTGGFADFSNYNGGRRGGKVRIRARIVEKEKKTLLITEIPYSTTTGSLIDSIIKANDKGKIKIKKVIDNTAKDLEIEIQLATGVSADKTIDALYAFTNCGISISPNACIIFEDKPHFLGVNDILKISSESTVELLRQELEIKKGELEEKWHFSSLEKIFIEERIYRDIEECETWEAIIETIDKGLDPYKKLLRREVTVDDITRLTEIRIKRISKFDSFKADDLLKSFEDQLKEVNHHLDNLIEFAIEYFKNLLKKYGKDKERKTEERQFDEVNATVVAVANQKLYVNRAEGFVGTGLKKDEYVKDCSDIDDIIVFRKSGQFSVSKVSSKAFFGKDILHVDVWRKGDERRVYNAIYIDGKTGKSYVKRFNVTSITRDKEYNVSRGTPNSKLLYFTDNPNGEAEIVSVFLHGLAKARIKQFDYDFADLAIKGRTAMGNTLSKYRVRKIELKSKGKSTIGGRKIWYEESIGRLNVDERGQLLGSFQTDDMILVVYRNGEYELTNHDLTNRYDPAQVLSAEKFDEKRVISAIHWDATNNANYVKRFHIETTSMDKKFLFINEGRANKLIIATTHSEPEVRMSYKERNKEGVDEVLRVNDLIDVKGWKANGNRLNTVKTAKFVLQSTEDPYQTVEEQVVVEPVVAVEPVVVSEPVVIQEIPKEEPPKIEDEKPDVIPVKKKPPKSKTKSDGKAAKSGSVKAKKKDADDQDIFGAGDQLNLL
jgi:topoisomerase IV subunit A